MPDWLLGPAAPAAPVWEPLGCAAVPVLLVAVFEGCAAASAPLGAGRDRAVPVRPPGPGRLR